MQHVCFKGFSVLSIAGECAHGLLKRSHGLFFTATSTL